MSRKNLYISISAHGFGHIGQMAPILNKLAIDYGNQIEFIIQCGAKEQILKQFFYFPFKHINRADDIGMLMVNSLDVQPQQTHRAYKEFHAGWEKQLMLKMREIDRYKAAAVVSNVSSLTLAAGKQLGIPTLGLCSLNWAEVYQSYCSNLPGSDAIVEKLLSHYLQADLFLIPTPGMAMTALSNQCRIGPLARLGNCFPGFRQQLGIAEHCQLVMVSMGGITHKNSHNEWPRLDNIHWIDASNQQQRADITPLNKIPYRFIDTLSHCDLLLCKPGYGLFVEATCNQVPVLYVKREQWPEEPFLVDWLQANNECLVLERQAFDQGLIGEPVQQLLQQASNNNPKRQPLAPTGVGEACGYILEALGLR